MHTEQKILEQKNKELADKFKEKAKQQQLLQKLYQGLKAQQLATGIELAAEHDAEHVLQAAGSATYNDSARRGGQHMHSRANSYGSGGRSRTIDAWQNQVYGGIRDGMQTSRRVYLLPPCRSVLLTLMSLGSAPVPPTPSGHRSRLPFFGNNGMAMGGSAFGGEGTRQATPYRPALGNLDQNVYGHTNGAGCGSMSAGVKAGRQPDGPINRSGYAVGRPMGIGGYQVR